MSFTDEEQAAISRAIQQGKVTRAELPEPIPEAEIAKVVAKAALPKRAHNAPIPTELIEEIKSLAGDYSRQEIANRVEVSVATVGKVLGETGPRRKVTAEIREGVLALRGKAGIAVIAARFSIGEATVSRIFKAAGVVRPNTRVHPPKLERPERKKPRTDNYKRKVTPEMRRQILELYGVKMRKEIARSLGLSQVTVGKVIKEAGVEHKRVPRPHELSSGEKATILALSAEGLSSYGISKRTGRNASSVRKFLCRTAKAEAAAGVRTRTRTPPRAGSPEPASERG